MPEGSEGEAPLSTRARRRSATKEALRAAALTMFAERGYEATTVRDIADSVDVTERTFFRYFPSKIDVLLDDLIALRPILLGALVERPAHERPLLAIRNAVLSLSLPGYPRWATLLPATGEPFAGGEVSEIRGGSARLLQVFADWEAGLVETLLEREEVDGDAPDELTARIRAEVSARAALAALRTALQHHHHQATVTGNPAPADFTTLVDTAFQALGVKD